VVNGRSQMTIDCWIKLRHAAPTSATVRIAFASAVTF
jgi:hypothetical protein